MQLSHPVSHNNRSLFAKLFTSKERRGRLLVLCELWLRNFLYTNKPLDFIITTLFNNLLMGKHIYIGYMTHECAVLFANQPRYIVPKSLLAKDELDLLGMLDTKHMSQAPRIMQNPCYAMYMKQPSHVQQQHSSSDSQSSVDVTNAENSGDGRFGGNRYSSGDAVTPAATAAAAELAQEQPQPLSQTPPTPAILFEHYQRCYIFDTFIANILQHHLCGDFATDRNLAAVVQWLQHSPSNRGIPATSATRLVALEMLRIIIQECERLCAFLDTLLPRDATTTTTTTTTEDQQRYSMNKLVLIRIINVCKNWTSSLTALQLRQQQQQQQVKLEAVARTIASQQQQQPLDSFVA